MAFLVVNTTEVEAEGGSNHINKSGIYNLTLRHAEVKNTQNGATQINYLFDRVMSYGNTILGNNGQPTFGYKVIESLATVVGTDELSDPEMVDVKFKTGTKELSCIPELNDVEVKAWIQFGYSMYKGEVRENVTVKRFYRSTDGAAGSEIAKLDNGKDAVIGERLEKDMQFAEEIKYDDGTNEESVKAWKTAQMGGGSTAPTSAAKPSQFPGRAKSGFPTAK